MTGVTFPASMSSVRALSSPFGLRAERPDEIRVLRAAHARDQRAERRGELDGERADAASGPVHQDGLDRLRVKNLTVGRRHGPVQKT